MNCLKFWNHGVSGTELCTQSTSIFLPSPILKYQWKRYTLAYSFILYYEKRLRWVNRKYRKEFTDFFKGGESLHDLWPLAQHERQQRCHECTLLYSKQCKYWRADFMSVSLILKRFRYSIKCDWFIDVITIFTLK